jgi:hypothetical protein
MSNQRIEGHRRERAAPARCGLTAKIGGRIIALFRWIYMHTVHAIAESALVNWFRGRPPRRLDPSRVSYCAIAGREPVSRTLFQPAPGLAVILAAGQSNIANEGDPDGRIVPGPGVYNFNIFDGECFVAKDPLLGATCDRSNVATRLGDLLVRSGVFSRVLLVPVGHGGTFVREWTSKGRMRPRLVTALKRLNKAGIAITHVLWQSGEGEAAQANADARAWIRDFAEIVTTIRAYGVTAPIYVAQCTVCCNGANEVIRSAQRAVCSPAVGVVAGPDLDVIGPSKRWDGCHFSAAGLEDAAQLWVECLSGRPVKHRTASQPG